MVLRRLDLDRCSRVGSADAADPDTDEVTPRLGVVVDADRRGRARPVLGGRELHGVDRAVAVADEQDAGADAELGDEQPSGDAVTNGTSRASSQIAGQFSTAVVVMASSPGPLVDEMTVRRRTAASRR